MVLPEKEKQSFAGRRSLLSSMAKQAGCFFHLRPNQCLFGEAEFCRKSLGVVNCKGTIFFVDRRRSHALVDDFVAVITSMASRIYRRRPKERAEKIKQGVGHVMQPEGKQQV